MLHSVKANFTRTTDLTWTWAIDPADGAGGGIVAFDADGQYDAANSSVTTPITIPGSTGADDISMTLDMTNITTLSTDTSASVASQDGLPPGTVSDIFISENDGAMYLVYTNGMKEQIGQLALARFSNPDRPGTLRQQRFHAGIELGRTAGRHRQYRWSRRHRRWLPGILQRGHGPGIHQHDPGPARLPGFLTGHHHFGRNSARTGQPEAVVPSGIHTPVVVVLNEVKHPHDRRRRSSAALKTTDEVEFLPADTQTNLKIEKVDSGEGYIFSRIHRKYR